MKEISIPVGTAFCTGYPVIRLASYQKECIETAKLLAPAIEKAFPDKELAFVCTGTSGLFLSTLLTSLIEDSSVVYVRKEEEQSTHSGTKVECCKSLLQRDDVVFLFVDDLMFSGRTFYNIHRTFRRNMDTPLVLNGIVLFCSSLNKDSIEEIVLRNKAKLAREEDLEISIPELLICTSRESTTA